MTPFRAPILILVFVAALAVVGAAAIKSRARPVDKQPDGGDEIARLQSDIARLETLVPNQPDVMTHVAFHFTNLWFAAAHRNWPLASYYLGEVRSNLKWAVRIRPTRTGPGGNVDLAGIAQSVDETQLGALQKAIHERRSAEFDRAYDETAAACTACHQAIGKPYLRPRRPSAPAETVIDADPATSAVSGPSSAQAVLPSDRAGARHPGP
jgi:cytochrome c553